MKAMVLATGKGTRLIELHVTSGVRRGRVESWQGRQRRSQSTALAYLGDVRRRCREQTGPMRFHGRSLPPSGFGRRRRCFRAEFQEAQREVCPCAA
jgi:hypothetical protein